MFAEDKPLPFHCALSPGASGKSQQLCQTTWRCLTYNCFSISVAWGKSIFSFCWRWALYFPGTLWQTQPILAEEAKEILHLVSMRVGSKPKQRLMNMLNQSQLFSADVIAIFYVEMKRRGLGFCPSFTTFSMPAWESSGIASVSP